MKINIDDKIRREIISAQTMWEGLADVADKNPVVHLLELMALFNHIYEGGWNGDSEDIYGYMRGVTGALHFFCDTYLPEQGIKCPIDTYKLLEAVYVSTAVKAEKRQENRKYGFLAYALWLFGSSKKQAYEAIAHTYGFSETKIKSYSSPVFRQKSFFPIEGQIDQIELHLDGLDLRSFPVEEKSYPKVSKAYSDLSCFLEEFAFIKQDENLSRDVIRSKSRELLLKKYPVVYDRCEYTQKLNEAILAGTEKSFREERFKRMLEAFKVG